jgi:hypothetical protein
MQEVKLCEGISIATRPLDKISLFDFTKCQVCLPLYPFFTHFGFHRNYKRKKREKRLKKIGKIYKNTVLFRIFLKANKKGRDKRPASLTGSQDDQAT